jgi:hypothetical protein
MKMKKSVYIEGITMDYIKIKVNNDSLYINSSNHIIGEIHLKKMDR